MNLPQGERDMILAFTEYAIENGDVGVMIKNFGGRKEEE